MGTKVEKRTICAAYTANATKFVTCHFLKLCNLICEYTGMTGIMSIG